MTNTFFIDLQLIFSEEKLTLTSPIFTLYFLLQYHPGAPFSFAVCSTAHLSPPTTGLQALGSTETGKKRKSL